jgi:flavin reductase (DIM6/NTAB) family NADH-FMN oxidoreductase RutF
MDEMPNLGDLELISDPADALRNVFRRHASGVAVITLLTEAGDPAGFTATSVTSLGTNPPLVSFNVARGASSFSSLEKCGYVAIHTLGQDDLALAQQMAGAAENRFKADNWVRAIHDLAVFPQASSILIGRIRQVISVEANAVVIVDVEQALLGEEKAGLLYLQRSYRSTGEVLAQNS